VAADVAATYETPAVGAGDEAAESIGPRAGVMPSVVCGEKHRIQQLHNNPSLSEGGGGTIATWADSGARGPIRRTCRRQALRGRAGVAIGRPDLIIKMQEIEVKGNAPDWWGKCRACERGCEIAMWRARIKEVNDVDVHARAAATVGGGLCFTHDLADAVLDGRHRSRIRWRSSPMKRA